MKVVGGAYLCWLGARTLADGGDAGTAGEVPRPYVAGVATNVLNPMVAVFFLAFLPQFVDRSAGATGSVPGLGATYAALTAAYLGGVGATAGRARATYREHADAFRIASGAVLVALGLGVLAAAVPASTFAPLATI